MGGIFSHFVGGAPDSKRIRRYAIQPPPLPRIGERRERERGREERARAIWRRGGSSTPPPSCRLPTSPPPPPHPPTPAAAAAASPAESYKLLQSLIDFLSEGDRLAEEGLFRVQGAEERRVEIQAAIDADAPLNMGEADTLVVAQVLKVRATHSGPNQLDTS